MTLKRWGEAHVWLSLVSCLVLHKIAQLVLAEEGEDDLLILFVYSKERGESVCICTPQVAMFPLNDSPLFRLIHNSCLSAKHKQTMY